MHGFNHAAVGGAVAVVTLRGLYPLAEGQAGPEITVLSAWGIAAIVWWMGVATHLLLDVFPHDDSFLPVWGEILLGILSLGLCYGLAGEGYGWLIFVGAWGGVSPDLEHWPYRKGWLTRRFFSTHTGLFPHRESSRVFSLTVQLPLFLASLAVIGWWG